MRSALALQTRVARWLLGVAAFVAVVLAVGSVSLLARVVRPALELTRAARRLGRGDLAARAKVARDDELGELTRTFNGMAEDIADREKARLDFVAGVAHDLKNPLVVIGGAARLLRSAPLAPAQQAAWLDRIVRQADRLEKLISDLMDTVQVSTGRLSLVKTALDLTALVRGLQQEQAEHFPQHALAFEGVEACWVSADRDRIERVAINLISNAVKYSQEGSEVALRVRRRETEAVFTVSDHGAGIAPEDLQVIFQPFGRGSQTRSMASGTGLGLSIVRQILEAHGGEIRVQSTVGVGTTVEVTLPLATERPGEAPTGDPPRAK
jgi:signal transduction histidine kinase